MDPTAFGKDINWNYVLFIVLPLIGLLVRSVVNSMDARTQKLRADLAEKRVDENAQDIKSLRDNAQAIAVTAARTDGAVSVVLSVLARDNASKEALQKQLEDNPDDDNNRAIIRELQISKNMSIGVGSAKSTGADADATNP